jgi:hypothetical protein
MFYSVLQLCESVPVPSVKTTKREELAGTISGTFSCQETAGVGVNLFVFAICFAERTSRDITELGTLTRAQRRYDTNVIFQMQGGKNWILPK